MEFTVPRLPLDLFESTCKIETLGKSSLVPRPSLPAFNVARKKLEEGLVRDITHMMQRIDSR